MTDTPSEPVGSVSQARGAIVGQMPAEPERAHRTDMPAAGVQALRKLAHRTGVAFCPVISTDGTPGFVLSVRVSGTRRSPAVGVTIAVYDVANAGVAARRRWRRWLFLRPGCLARSGVRGGMPGAGRLAPAFVLCCRCHRQSICISRMSAFRSFRRSDAFCPTAAAVRWRCLRWCPRHSVPTGDAVNAPVDAAPRRPRYAVTARAGERRQPDTDRRRRSCRKNRACGLAGTFAGRWRRYLRIRASAGKTIE